MSSLMSSSASLLVPLHVPRAKSKLVQWKRWDVLSKEWILEVIKYFKNGLKIKKKHIARLATYQTLLLCSYLHCLKTQPEEVLALKIDAYTHVI